MTKSHHRRSSTASSIVSAILRSKRSKRSSLSVSEASSSLTSSGDSLSPSHYPRTIPIQFPVTTTGQWDANSPPACQTALLSLPAEVRLQVYSYIFEPTPPQRLEHGSSKHQIQPSDCIYTRARLRRIQSRSDLTPGANMLLVCRQLYHECLPLLRRTVLITPRLMDPVPQDADLYLNPAATKAYLAARKLRALPLDRTRLGSLDALALQRLSIRELVVSEMADNLPTASELTEWERSGRIVRVPFKVESIYLRLCTCCNMHEHSSPTVPGTPDYARLRAGQLAGAAYAVFLSVAKVERIVVYYCSVTAVPPHHGVGDTRMAPQVQAMQNVFAEIVMEKRIDGSDIWWAEAVDMSSGLREIDGVTRYSLTFPEYEGRPSGSVVIEFYDSYSQTGSKCVAS